MIIFFLFRFRVKFEDGIEKTVRGVDMILAQHLPIGQSVLVASEDNAGDAKTYDPGIIIEHIIEDNDVFYTVAMDDGSNRRYSAVECLPFGSLPLGHFCLFSMLTFLIILLI